MQRPRTSRDKDSFLERVAMCYDNYSILDMLDITVEDVVEAFADRIVENYEVFEACLDLEEDE